MKFPTSFVSYAGAAGILAGVLMSTSRAEIAALPSVAQLEPRVDLDPFRDLKHVGMFVSAHQARARLDEGRPWAAWNAVRDYAATDSMDLPPEFALLAARSAAGWEGWGHVRRLLEGKRWLAEQDGGTGLMLLGRAEEEGGDWAAAIHAYRRYAAVATGAGRGMARARLAGVLRRAGRDRDAADAYAAAAVELPEVADWMTALRGEALAAAGDGSVTTLLPAGSSAARAALARAEARYRSAAGDAAGAAARLRAEADALAPVDPAEAGELSLEAARTMVARGGGAEARPLLARVAGDERAAASIRSQAASLLGDLPGDLTVDEELARASAYESAGKPGLAARSLRTAISRGAAGDGATFLRIARLLFAAADYEPAHAWAEKAAAKLGGDAAGDAELIAARSLVRLGKEDDGVAALHRLAERRAGTAAAGSAWFLLGDAAADRDAAIADYRRAAATPSPDAREAQFRVGDRCDRAGDDDCAAKAWEEYAARFPRGDETAQAAYAAGVLHERAGRAERARALYAAAIAAEPVSYYAIRAADRLGVDPLAASASSPVKWTAFAGDDEEAAAAIRRLRALQDIGAEDAWKDELDAQVRRLESRPYALLVLAEGVRDAGHAVDGIRLGRRLLELRGGAWDGRLLRLVFPFPYRDVLLDEARASGVDPWLFAGLVRQESSFDRQAKSWVGAAGLSQIMPATGAWLAPAAGVRSYDPSLLTVPEINLRMGARFLGDQLRRYHGAWDLALAAYNAGPARADRWKTDLGYGRDVDGFREKIPFAETREYVKVVIRNAEVYRRLYGPERSPGLVDAAP